MVFLVEDNIHDRVHDCIWDLDFLCSLHFNDTMTYSIGFHESFEIGGEVLINEGAAQDQHVTWNYRGGAIYTMVFKPRVPRYWKSSVMGKLLR